jgi:hypothetical protein
MGIPIFQEIPMPESPIVINRRVTGLLWAFFLFLLMAGLVALVVLLVVSGYLPPKDEGPFGVIKTVFILGLLIAIGFAGVGYGLTRILLWAVIGEDITFRNLIGTRRLPWSEIARFDMSNFRQAFAQAGTAGRLLMSMYQNLFDVVGELQITTITGARLELRLKSSEWDQLRDRGLGKWRPEAIRPIQLTRGRAIAFLTVGLATLLVGIYLDYLCITGDWQSWMGDYAESIEEKIGLVLLSALVPIAGVVVMVYGVAHLRRG